MMSEELVKARMAEMQAEAEVGRDVARLRALRRAERRYLKARARLAQVRSQVGYVGRPQVSS